MPCQDCLYFEKLPSAPDTGLCHRFPPSPGFVPGQPLGLPYWPIMHIQSWCGEWLRQEAPEAREEPKLGATGETASSLLRREPLVGKIDLPSSLAIIQDEEEEI
jgi:hypothetical protein